MTTIVLVHPAEHSLRFQVFAVYQGDVDPFCFGLQEFADRNEAERAAREMMEIYEADHFRRIIVSPGRVQK